MGNVGNNKEKHHNSYTLCTPNTSKDLRTLNMGWGVRKQGAEKDICVHESGGDRRVEKTA